MKLVCISDTHEQEDGVVLPDGDVLVHAGDITYRGDLGKLSKFLMWMKNQPHTSKVIISGNHDWCFQNNNRSIAVKMCEEAEVTYLEDSGVKIGDLHFWGSPWQPWFHNWAFNAMRGKDIARHWAKIPENTNVLITHGPVMNIMDEAPRGVFDIEHVGCEELAKRIVDLPNLKAHICGHIHAGYGTKQLANVQFVNASICTEQYKPTNAPIVIEV